MKFIRMHGIDDDYLYFNCFEEPITDPAALSTQLSDRCFEAGSGGIILIGPSDKTDCSVDIYNADGSYAMMCGNGIRCMGKYAYERGIVKRKTLTVDTQSRVKTLFLTVDENNRVTNVTTNMGKPEFPMSKVLTLLEIERMIDHPMEATGKEYRIICISIGSPHCVVFVDDVDAIPLSPIDPLLELHRMSPQHVNTEFTQTVGENKVRMCVWKCGSGETWACGTGVYAVAVACALGGKTDRQVLAHLKGSNLNA